VAFRAKTYENRKKEKKLQVSGDQSEFNKLVKGDAEAKEAFDKALSEALKK
jgi:transcription termination factor NusB